MTAPHISIIIPIYNAAAYIEQCVRSVLDQTKKEIEVIAVNDGSTDNSAELLNKLATSDQRLKVFHLSNGGVSASRNYGLQRAKGIYIGFCDADDFIEPGMLEELYVAMVSNKCDLGICNVLLIKESEDPKIRLELRNEIIHLEDQREIFFQEMLRFRYDNANWNKIFVADIIREHQLQFNPDMSIYEDLLFNLQYVHYATKVYIVDKPLYNYRVLQNSLYGGSMSSRLQQFNLLFTKYLEFADKYAGNSEREIFRREMARATYNQFLYAAEIQVLEKNRSFFQVLKKYNSELHKFNPFLFYYPPAQRKGIQGIKKALLHHKYLRIFAFITALKPWLRKPYRFVRQILHN